MHPVSVSLWACSYTYNSLIPRINGIFRNFYDYQSAKYPRKVYEPHYSSPSPNYFPFLPPSAIIPHPVPTLIIPHYQPHPIIFYSHSLTGLLYLVILLILRSSLQGRLPLSPPTSSTPVSPHLINPSLISPHQPQSHPTHHNLPACSYPTLSYRVVSPSPYVVL